MKKTIAIGIIALQHPGGLISRFVGETGVLPGTTIMVRATGENYPNTAAAMDCQLPTMGFATIKWRRDDIHRGRSIHRMGAVYVMLR